VIQNSPDRHGIFYTGDDLDRALALVTDFNVDIEYALQALGPAHCHMTLGEAAIITILNSLPATLAPARRCDQSPKLAVMSMDGRYAENAGAFFCGAQTHHGSE